MNIHVPREITIQTCKNPKQINHSYPPLNLFHAEEYMNNHEYSCIWKYLMGDYYTKSKQI